MIMLDTCVISETIRPNPSAKVLMWLDTVPEQHVHIPVIVLGELQKGVDLLPDGSKRAALILWLEQLRERFRGRIVVFDEEAAVTWGSLTARQQLIGCKLPAIDGMLAALVLRHSAVLATRNTADFKAAGIEMVNPWQKM